MNTELIAESRSHADSLRVVMQDQAAETIESLCSALEALQAEVARLETLAKGQHVELYNARLRLAELEISNAELERLCDATYVAQGADAYNHACECMEAFQEKRRATGKEVGTTHSLCDGMGWVYRRLDELEAAGASLVATPIVAWAKSTPKKLRITTMDMGREDGWRPLGYTAAGASPVEPSQALGLTDEELNVLWNFAVETGNPTAGNAHLRFARAIIAAINAKESK